jgi:hypothetical protein
MCAAHVLRNLSFIQFHLHLLYYKHIYMYYIYGTYIYCIHLLYSYTQGGGGGASDVRSARVAQLVLRDRQPRADGKQRQVLIW